MLVSLSTVGKFHTFDLARQLERRGMLANVVTGYPHVKLRQEGIPMEKIVSAPVWQIAHHRLNRSLDWWPGLQRSIEWWSAMEVSKAARRRLPDCDAYVALSGSGLEAGRETKLRGKVYVCDRGSSHIRYQDALLRDEFSRHGQSFAGVDPRMIEREEAEYALADAITVPSTFVLRSFLEMGVDPAKMRRVAYGVDLSRFHPTGAPDPDEFRALFVGALSIRKGVPYLLDAFRRVSHPRKRLVLVGVPLPETASLIEAAQAHATIEVLGRLPQTEVRDQMSRASALVLPSLEEGLALVQAQALACGCPVIASVNTGSEDLFSDGEEGFIVPVRDPEALADRMQRLADDPGLRQAMSNRALERVKAMGGWDQYGDRMVEVLEELVGRAGGRP